MRSIYWAKKEFKWWILLLCAYHFFPFITVKGSVLMYVWAYAVPILYIALNINYLKRIISIISRTEILVPIISILFISCLSILIPVAHGTSDLTYLTSAIMTMIKIMIRMLFIVLVILKHVPNATKETYMKYFIFSCCLYILGTIIMLAIPQIKDIFYNLVKEPELSKELALDSRYGTRYGWGGFSGFEYTFKCVFAIICNNYLIEKNIKNRKIWWMLGVTVVLLIGTLFYGRIGFFAAMLVMLALCVRLLKKRPKILLVAIIGIVIAAVGLLVLQARNATVQNWFKWAFDLFLTFFETGKLETGSSNVLLDRMLFIPDMKTILMGDGMYSTATGYYMETDSGLMRPLLFGGIIFALLRYFSFYMLLVISTIKKKQFKEVKAMYFWIGIVCFIFEIKGEIIFSCLPIILWFGVFESFKSWREKRWSEI